MLSFPVEKYKKLATCGTFFPVAEVKNPICGNRKTEFGLERRADANNGRNRAAI
jgi:hypothetical protein